ncbi:MAG: hypothetical protein QOG04_685 [Actinomycetota bacterium]|nr:hypothetical protein [Actinomycetota bacterium]
MLYCDTSNEEETRRFYVEILGLRQMAFEFSYRVGNENHVFLIFNRDRTVDQEMPPAHGATGKGHSCFTAEPGTYESWKTYFDEVGVEWGKEIEWGNGMKSFYFEDPAGNVLEIAEADFWPHA